MPDTTATGTAYSRPPRQRSFAGPIVLIVIGALFLFGNLHMVTWRSIVMWFGHWWPLLLIVYGVLKLVEYYTAKREGTQFNGVGAGGVLLVIFIILFGLTVTAISRVDWSQMGPGPWDGGDWGKMFGQEYTYTQTLEQDYPTGANLKVVSQHGTVNVLSWDQNKIKVEVTKKLRAEGQENADRMDKDTQAAITVAANEVTLTASTGGRPVTADLLIYVPRKSPVTIDNTRGDVTVQSRDGSVRITTSHGDVSLQDVNGSADVSMRHGDFKASKIAGDINLDGRLDDVSAAEVIGNLRMTGEYFGDLNISKISKQITFKTSRTDLQVTKLDGEMSIQSDTLHANAINGPVRIATRSKDLHLEDVSGNIDLNNSNAVVEVRAADKFGQININNRNGGVDLILPAKASFQIQATSEKGNISSDYGLNTNSQNGNNTASGQVGSGGPKIQINSQHGDVNIKKAT